MYPSLLPSLPPSLLLDHGRALLYSRRAERALAGARPKGTFIPPTFWSSYSSLLPLSSAIVKPAEAVRGTRRCALFLPHSSPIIHPCSPSASPPPSLIPSLPQVKSALTRAYNSSAHKGQGLGHTAIKGAKKGGGAGLATGREGGREGGKEGGRPLHPRFL